MKPESKKPSSEVAEQTRTEERTRIREIKAAFPDDPKFALEQIDDGATVAEAKAAYADVLKEQLVKERTEKAELATKLGKAQAPSKPAPPAGDPVPFAGSADAQDAPTDFVALARTKAKDEGISFEKAASRLAREDPAGHDAWVDGLPQRPISRKGTYTRIGKPQR